MSNIFLHKNTFFNNLVTYGYTKENLSKFFLLICKNWIKILKYCKDEKSKQYVKPNLK